MNTLTTIIVIQLLIILPSIYIIVNLNNKVKKFEGIVDSQVDYLRKVSYLIQESKLYIDKLDEKGIFQSDDEVGTFFNFMKEIQETINAFRLPEDYGKKETK